MTATFTLSRMYRGDYGVDVTWTMVVHPIGDEKQYSTLIHRARTSRWGVWSKLPGGAYYSPGFDRTLELFVPDPEG